MARLYLVGKCQLRNESSGFSLDASYFGSQAAETDGIQQ